MRCTGREIKCLRESTIVDNFIDFHIFFLNEDIKIWWLKQLPHTLI